MDMSANTELTLCQVCINISTTTTATIININAF